MELMLGAWKCYLQKNYIFIGLAVGSTLFVLYGLSQTRNYTAKMEMPMHRSASSTRMVTIHGPTTETITRDLKSSTPTTEIITRDPKSNANSTVAELVPPWNGPTNKSMQYSTDHLSLNATVTMLFWTGWYGTSPWLSKTRRVDCHQWGGYECTRTSEKRYFNNSDAIIFHSRASDLFNSVKQALALMRPLHQRWVLYTDGESPANTYNLGVLNGLINWTGSYMTDADFIGGASVVPGIFQDGFNSTKNYLENRTGMAAILVSHCVPARMNWVKKLQEYIDVDVYGKCGTLQCSSREKCYEALRKYRFYLSFENSYCKDYVTEKFYHNSLQNEIVPVIISWADTSSTSPSVPPGSFINALDFHTVNDLAEHMNTVGSRPDLYNEYFRWRSVYSIEFGYDKKLFCDVCKRLHLDRHSVSSYPDVASWFSFKRNCKPYPVPY